MAAGGKTVVGLTESVEIFNSDGRSISLTARIDTGADRSSVDEEICRKLGLGPEKGYRIVKQVTGKLRRPYVEAGVRIAGRELRANLSVADRKHMKYKILIGKDILKMGFLIDPDKG